MNFLQNVQQNKILVIIIIRKFPWSSPKKLVIPIFINFPMISDGYDEKNDEYHKN
jgi:hypothetical protein